MIKYSIDSTTLSDIADSIRTKRETSDPIAVSDFSTEILRIQGGTKTSNFSPESTETLIADNTSHLESFTFTEDYHNYTILKFVVVRNSDDTIKTHYFMTPGMVDAVFQYSSNRLNFNEVRTNYYVVYTKSENTWSQYGSRSIKIESVYGLTFTNCTLDTTVLYSRQAITGGNVTFTPAEGTSFYDYDRILFSTCTGDSTETQPCFLPFRNDLTDFGEDPIIIINSYNNATPVVITDTTITSFRYFYVVGVKFNNKIWT